LGILVGFSFFIVIFFVLSRGIIRDLEDISRAVQKISLGRFDVEIPKRSPDELGELAENINRMTVRLKTSIEEERDADRSKNELITGVSHDLRTPLTSLLGYLELIEKDKSRNEAELRRYVSIAYSKALRLRMLIENLFEYTKVSFGGFTINPSRIDMKELLEQLAEEFVPAFREAGMECRVNASQANYFVSADGDLLVRVFENLMTNALRYGAPERGIDVELSRDGAWVVIRVVNNGEMISRADLPHLFERFYRVERFPSDRTGGSGLGLAIAKSILDVHGGTITASSGESRTVFEVRLRSDSSIP
jgi:signal transduction histidine kinase